LSLAPRSVLEVERFVNIHDDLADARRCYVATRKDEADSPRARRGWNARTSDLSSCTG
jgi:hypothetical protein